MFLLLAVLATVHAASQPSGLLTDWKKPPAMGVSSKPSFTWVVAPDASAAASNTPVLQAAYLISVTAESTGAMVWNSSKVASNQSVAVAYGGPALTPGAAYSWTVTTWLNTARSSPSTPSAPASFVVALDTAAWGSAAYVGTGDKSTFVFLRAVPSLPSSATKVRRATASITAYGTDTMLCSYKLFLNGVAVGAGPGRGEAPVLGGDGSFRSNPFDTLDVTAAMQNAIASGSLIVGIQGMNLMHNVGVLMRMDIDFGTTTLTVATDNGTAWSVFGADSYLNPTPGTSHSAGNGGMEFIDAQKEPVGWKTDPKFSPSSDWKPAATTGAVDPTNLQPKMAPAIELLPPRSPTAVYSVPAGPSWPAPKPAASSTPGGGASFMVDFGRAFQGGVMFNTSAGVAGQRVRLVSGEVLVNGTSLDQHNTWGWDLTWTFRDGQQTLVQHQYMLFRYLWVTFLDAPPPSDWNVQAWGAQYPWDAADTSFTSSDKLLNDVWNLCAYTLQAGVLDTYIDSNTRERRPYEADGLIATAARQFLQRDFSLLRHSVSYLMKNPTWPVEWLQITPLLALADYMATGENALAVAYQGQLVHNTMIGHIDPTGLINTSWPHARHIIGWDPAQTSQMFNGSDYFSVDNAFAVRGLQVMADLLPDNTTLPAMAATLRKAMMSMMYDTSASRFCDGLCDDDAHHGIDSDMFTMFLDMVPPDAVATVYKNIVEFGLEDMGDYGGFVYINALITAGGDNGTAMHTALTKCDAYSWCIGLKDYNLTMTRESWSKVKGTYGATESHLWGTAAIQGVVQGLAGLKQLSPTFSAFSVAPTLGPVESLSVRVPTARGFITIAANSTAVVVDVPCNTVATVCTPPVGTLSSVFLDGAAVSHTASKCVTNVGCAATPRVLTWAA